MYRKRPTSHNVTEWYIYKTAEGYQVDDQHADTVGERVAGPYRGQLGFSRAYDHMIELIKGASDNA